MTGVNILKPNKENLNLFLIIGALFFILGILDLKLVIRSFLYIIEVILNLPFGVIWSPSLFLTPIPLLPIEHFIL